MWDLLIINPMTNALLLFYHFLGNNFVLAIAVFTILIRLVTLPLNMKQQRSSMRMQSMQPQIKAIQTKYKDNPTKMNEEFKKIGYNPAESITGCLPLLIQFPILIGLYRAIILLLGSTPLSLLDMTGRVYSWVSGIFDLSSALPIPNKFLWLNLAQPDPLYVLPILVFATMFLQNKLMSPAKPAAKDDKKKGPEESPMAGMGKSMQYTMPIMFGVFSLSFPSGVSVYFVLSSIIGILQSYYTRKTMANEEEGKAVASVIGPTTGIPASTTAKLTTAKKSISAPGKSKKKKRRK